MAFVNLHRHDMSSAYDGFGKPKDVVEYVKNIGQTALGITNHGNVAGIVDHYFNCKEADIKPIIGIEAYFVPSLKKDPKPKDTYHLILLVKNEVGYKNLMQLISKANEEYFYYKPLIDLRMLKEFGEGLICSTACGSGFIPQMLLQGKNKTAAQALRSFKKIFGNDFYLEVMAHKMHTQVDVNKAIIKFGKETNTPIILTTDSHYTTKDDFETHKIMVSMKNADFTGYPDAYIPSEEEVIKIWNKNHKELGSPMPYILATQEVADKCNFDIEFGDLIPKFGKDGIKKLQVIATKRLKKLGKFSTKYQSRLSRELKVIDDKGYSDYFLICHDIIDYANKNKIAMDFGRGSVGGSLLAYALGITQVDPLIHNTLFERFLRPDRSTLPDIDMDFDTRRRHEILEYIAQKYPQGSAQIVSYGKWQVKNTLGGLCKLYNYDDEIKDKLAKRIFDLIDPEEDDIDYNRIVKDKLIGKVESMSGGMIKHFCKLYGQTSYFGTHASGVAIVEGDIRNYMALMKSAGGMVTSADKYNLDKLNILKLDILGLETATIIDIAESLTGTKFNESMLKDKKTIQAFKRAETDGIFQFDTRGGKGMLLKVQPDNFQEVVACTAMNRPAPLKLGVVDNYVEGKDGNVDFSDTPWYKYTKDTYGQIIYQEQVMIVCRKVAKLDWEDIDKIMKDASKSQNAKNKELKKKFIKGAMGSGWSRDDASNLYDSMTLYLFNRAHGTAYTLVSWYAMYLMQHYPLEFIFALLSRETLQIKLRQYESLAVSKGYVVLLPHVNGSANYSLKDFQGEKVIQAGLSSIKGIGKKTAEEIINNGPYTCEELIEQRVSKRAFNSGVREALRNAGALEFRQPLYEKRVVRYNATLLNEYEWNADQG